MSPNRTQLLQAAQNFCTAFAEKKDMETIMSSFTKTHQPCVIEHGLPQLAPFLGTHFEGPGRVQEYFEMIHEFLDYDDVKFTDFTIDSERARVVCRGSAKFTWRNTKESWDETFVYILDFDQDSKITDYQIWADTGAAYLARIGKLKAQSGL